MTLTLINLMDAAHASDYILERGLRLTHAPRDLHLDGGKHCHGLPYHFGGDFNSRPAAKVGPSFGGSAKWSGGFDNNMARVAADSFARPAHA